MVNSKHYGQFATTQQIPLYDHQMLEGTYRLTTIWSYLNEGS